MVALFWSQSFQRSSTSTSDAVSFLNPSLKSDCMEPDNLLLLELFEVAPPPLSLISFVQKGRLETGLKLSQNSWIKQEAHDGLFQRRLTTPWIQPLVIYGIP